MPLLNYTPQIPPEQTASEIMSILTDKGATDVEILNEGDRKPIGLRWRVNAGQGPLTFAVPINAESVFQVLTQQKVMLTKPDARMEQANRTAWRIIKNWMLAQMALIETNMATMDQVFLPYLLTDGQTLYHALAEGNLNITPASDLPMLASSS